MKHRESGINPNVKQTNGAVAVFDNGGRIDDVGQHHGRRRSKTRTAVRVQMNQRRSNALRRGRTKAKTVLNKRQLALGLGPCEDIRLVGYVTGKRQTLKL